MDLVAELVQQSANPSVATKVIPKAEPMYGLPSQQDFGSAPQRFSEPTNQAPVQEAATVMTESKPAETITTPLDQKKEKYSCYNPQGSPPEGLRPAECCLKCKYFDSYGVERDYSIDPNGHCELADFSVRGGYVCNSFYSLSKYRAEVRESIKAEADQVVVSAYTDKIDNKEVFSNIADLETGVAFTKKVEKKEVKEEPATKEVLSESTVQIEPKETMEVVETTEKQEIKNKLEYSDKELYSEAISLTKSKFKNPDSPIAQSYCKHKYTQLFSAKRGTKEGAFVTTN